MAATRSKTSDAKRGNLEEDETLIPLKLVKELLNQQQSTMKSFLGAYMDSINARIDNIIKDVQSVKSSLEFTQAQVDELLQTEPEAEEPKSEINELEDKVDDLENRSRRNNLCFEGIAESVGENWQQTENKVKELISTYMPEVGDDVVIERAHRVGKTRPSEAKPRKIVARFFNYKDRESILKAKKKLHGTNIFINEDYSDRVMKKRKDLMPKLKEARKKNLRAFLRYDKLIIHDNAPQSSAATQDHRSTQELSVSGTSDH